MPPILRLDIPEHRGEVDVKTAYVPGLDGFAIKISPGFFDNPKLGLPSLNGLMVLFSARTGLVEALLLDNGYLTDVRTAAAGAVAAKHLARPEAAVATVLGAGVAGAAAAESADAGAADHAGAHLGARRRQGEGGGCCRSSRDLGIAVSGRARPEPPPAPVRTSSSPARRRPSRSCGRPGSSPASTSPRWAPMPSTRTRSSPRPSRGCPTSPTASRRPAAWASCITPSRQGSSRATRRFPSWARSSRGRRRGEPRPRPSRSADLTGTGVQDTAIATLAHRRAVAAGAGRQFETRRQNGSRRVSQPGLHFERSEYAERLKKTRAAMERAGIELLLVTDPSNMHWLTGYDGWSFYVHQCVLVPGEGEPVWYGRGQDGIGARCTTWLAEENIRSAIPTTMCSPPSATRWTFCQTSSPSAAGSARASASRWTITISRRPLFCRFSAICRTPASRTRRRSSTGSAP